MMSPFQSCYLTVIHLAIGLDFKGKEKKVHKLLCLECESGLSYDVLSMIARRDSSLCSLFIFKFIAAWGITSAVLFTILLKANFCLKCQDFF